MDRSGGNRIRNLDGPGEHDARSRHHPDFTCWWRFGGSDRAMAIAVANKSSDRFNGAANRGVTFGRSSRMVAPDTYFTGHRLNVRLAQSNEPGVRS